MYVVAGRFHFRPMSQEERGSMFQHWQQEFTPLVQACAGFQGVDFVPLNDDEVLTVWNWDNESAWLAAQAPFDPFLQQHVIPNLVAPLDRSGGTVALHVPPA